MITDLKLELDASLDDLERVRDFVEGFGKNVGIDHDTLVELVLAVDEAVTNVIVHGYEGRGGRVSVELEPEGQDLTIVIRDEGRPYDPDTVREPDIEQPLAERKIGGAGVYLIRKFTDAMDVSHEPGQGNTMTLLRRNAITADSRIRSEGGLG